MKNEITFTANELRHHLGIGSMLVELDCLTTFILYLTQHPSEDFSRETLIGFAHDMVRDWGGFEDNIIERIEKFLNYCERRTIK